VEDGFSNLAPHRPLRQGAVEYAQRPEGGGSDLADAVRAGWRRIAVVGPMGVGKSTELAAAQEALSQDRFAFRIGLDLSFDMRRIEAGEVFLHILTHFLAARPNPTIEMALQMAQDPARGANRDLRRDLARRALRAAGNAVLIVDGLEKAEDAAARAVAEELFALSDDADVVLVVPMSFAYGPGAAILGEDVRLFPVRPVLVWGPPIEDCVRGKLFLREVALRHLHRPSLAPTAPDQALLELIENASVASGGVPRVLLQLLRDAHRHAVVARRSWLDPDNLEKAKQDHGEQLRRSLLQGDKEVLVKAEGQDGSDVPLDRKLRFLLQGHLMEYRRGDRFVMHMAPTLARALRASQEAG
jgi:AAA ATPase domain